MKKLWLKIQKFWLFHVANPVVQIGEGHGFRYVVRRYWLEIETISGNWKMRVTASEHPYGYLVAGLTKKSEENLFGFAETMYYLNATLTRDQRLVNDIQDAIRAYETRLSAAPVEEENEDAAIAEVKKVQEYVEATPKQRKKMERDVNGRFKKVLKEASEA